MMSVGAGDQGTVHPSGPVMLICCSWMSGHWLSVCLSVCLLGFGVLILCAHPALTLWCARADP